MEKAAGEMQAVMKAQAVFEIFDLSVVECPRSGCIETTVKSKRLSEVSEKARRIIDDFKTFSDTAYGCVKLL